MNYIPKFREVQDKSFELFKRKNSDYGNAFEEHGTIGILVRINDKIKRAMNISGKQMTLVDDESLRDTLVDLHNYCALAIVLIDKENENKIKRNQMLNSMDEDKKSILEKISSHFSVK